MITNKIKTIIILLTTFLIVGCDSNVSDNFDISYSVENQKDYKVDKDILISIKDYEVMTKDISEQIKLTDESGNNVNITILITDNVSTNSQIITIQHDRLEANTKYKLIVDSLILYKSGQKNKKRTRTIDFTTEKDSNEANMIKDLQEQLNLINTNKTDLENQLNTSNDNKVELQNQIDTLTNERLVLQTQLDSSNDNKVELQNQINTLDNNILVLTTEKNSLQNNITDLETNITDLQTNITDLETNITDLQNQIDILTAVPTYKDMSSLLHIETSIITSNIQQNIILVFKENVNAYSFYNGIKITDSSNNELAYTLNVKENLVSIKLDNGFSSNETYTIHIDKLIQYDGSNDAYKIIFNTSIDQNHLNTYFTI